MGASAFWSYSNPSSSGNQFPNETNYLNEGFRVVYPPINEDAYDFAPIKELVDFIDLSSDDDFKDSFEQYFNKESVLKYYLFCMVFNSVDTLSKNLHLCRYNDVFYILPYDCDSAVGGNNQGYLNVPADAEVGDLYDENNPDTIIVPNHYNSWNSRLWARVRDTFRVDLESTYISLRSNGVFTINNILKYFDEIIDVIPPTMYNESQQIKYIDYGEVGQIALHGNRKLQIRKHLRERLAYLDSKYGFYSDGGTENYVNLRMAKIGDVSLEIETYYPVYYTVKWASNHTETHRIAKGEKVSFSYYSDVSADREVLLYLPETIKVIEGLNTLQPTTIDISKATKLNKIECASEKLYSVSLATNKYLRRVDFNGCKLLGSDTTSTLSLLYAKYLNYVDIRGTILNTVNFNPQGGSLKECYLPNTLTSLTLKNQMLLTDLILPYGENGVNVSQNLATIEISNCPNIHKMAEDETIDTFAPIKHCRRLLLNNSYDMETMNFNGFTRLQNITLSNLESLVNMGLNDLCEVGGTSSLRYVGVSACPNLKELTMNCTSDDYEITFAERGLLDLSTSNITTINSNCILKGLQTIVVPSTIKDMFFTKDYGSGNSDVKNIWSARACVIDSSSVFPNAKHLDVITETTDNFVGIDFYNLNLRNIDLSALVNIPEAINFSLSPTTVNPNFNLYRDNVTIPYLQPVGTLDLSNYTESLAKFFNGVDLEQLTVICNNDLPQTDYSYCFYNAYFSSVSYIQSVLDKIVEVTNADHMFYKTTVSDVVSIMDELNMSADCIADYMFGECENIMGLNNLLLTGIGSAKGMFYKCNNLETATDMTIKVNGSTKEMFRECGNLQTVARTTIIGSTDMSYMFYNNKKQTDTALNIPTTCQGNVEKCYANTNITTLKNFTFEAQYEGFISPPIFGNTPMTTIEDTVTIDVNFGKFNSPTDYYSIFSNIGTITDVNINVGANCKSLEAGLIGNPIRNCTIGGDAVYTSIRAFICNSNAIRCPVNFDSPNIVDASYFYYNCPNISGDIVVNGHFAQVAEDLSYMLANTKITSLRMDGDYSNLKSLRGLVANTPITKLDLGDMVVSSNLNSLASMCENTSSLVEIILPSNLEESTITNLEKLCYNSKPVNGEIMIRNFRLPDSFVELGEYALGGVYGVTVYNVTLDNVYIPHNEALKIFSATNTTNNTYNWVKTIKSIEFNPNYAEDWVLDYAFKECTRLENDFTMPLSTKSCVECFKNCTGMVEVQSNWKQNYSLTITPTDCYKGCTNIYTIDDKVVVTQYSNGLDEVPIEWGGYGFSKATTGVYEINLPVDGVVFNHFHDQMAQDTVIDFGDGETITSFTWGVGTPISHTYERAGTYIIRAKNTRIDFEGSFGSYVTKILQHPTNLIIATNYYRGCTNATYVDISDATMTNADYVFYGNTSITTFIAKNLTLNNVGMNWISNSNITELDVSTWKIIGKGCFGSWREITTLDVSSVDFSRMTNADNLFRGLHSVTNIIGVEDIDTSQCSSFSGTFEECRSLINLDLSNWNTQKASSFSSCFSGCEKLTDLNISNFSSNLCENMSSMFCNCKALKFLDLNHLNVVNVKKFTTMFEGCSSLHTVLLDQWLTTSATHFEKMFGGCTVLENIDVSNFVTNKATTFFRMFLNCKALKTIDISNFDWSETTNINEMFSNTGLTVFPFSNHEQFPKLKAFASVIQGCGEMTGHVDLSDWYIPVCTSITGLSKTKMSEFTFPKDMATVNSLSSLFSSTGDNNTSHLYLKNIHGLDLTFLSRVKDDNWACWMFAYGSTGGVELNIDWEGLLPEGKGKAGRGLFTLLTYANSTTYGRYKKVTLASWEDLLLNHLSICQNNSELYMPTAIINLLSPEAVASATSKNWTIVGKD